MTSQLGPYRIEGLLGRGAMGKVHRAYHEGLQRYVALKVPSDTGNPGPDEEARFAREARLACALRHANLVTIYDAGVVDGTRYIAMELLEGETLGSRLERSGSPGWIAAARLVLGLAGALEVVHEQGILHRDIKPANVMVCPDGEPRLLDLGLARAVDGTAVTATGALVGTPAFMAPEVLSGDAASVASDLWGLGCVLYAALAGRPPVTARSIDECVNAVLHLPLVLPPEVAAGLPPDLVMLVDRLLDKQPARRPGSAREVAGVLRGLLARVEPQPPPTLKLPSAPVRRTRSRAPRSSPPRPRLGAGALAGACSAVGVALALYLLLPGPAPLPRPAATLAAPPASSAAGVDAFLARAAALDDTLTHQAVASPDVDTSVDFVSGARDRARDAVAQLAGWLAGPMAGYHALLREAEQSPPGIERLVAIPLGHDLLSRMRRLFMLGAAKLDRKEAPGLLAAAHRLQADLRAGQSDLYGEVVWRALSPLVDRLLGPFSSYDDDDEERAALDAVRALDATAARAHGSLPLRGLITSALLLDRAFAWRRRESEFHAARSPVLQLADAEATQLLLAVAEPFVAALRERGRYDRFTPGAPLFLTPAVDHLLGEFALVAGETRRPRADREAAFEYALRLVDATAGFGTRPADGPLVEALRTAGGDAALAPSAPALAPPARLEERLQPGIRSRPSADPSASRTAESAR